jgi:hypothetical protein
MLTDLAEEETAFAWDYVVHKQLQVEFVALRQTRRRAQHQAATWQDLRVSAPVSSRALLLAARGAPPLFVKGSNPHVRLKAVQAIFHLIFRDERRM